MKDYVIKECQKEVMYGFETGDFSAAEAIQAENDKTAISIYDAMIGGEIPGVYRVEEDRFMAYTMSARHEHCIQCTFGYYAKDGELIFTTHQDIFNEKDMTECKCSGIFRVIEI